MTRLRYLSLIALTAGSGAAQGTVTLGMVTPSAARTTAASTTVTEALSSTTSAVSPTTRTTTSSSTTTTSPTTSSTSSSTTTTTTSTSSSTTSTSSSTTSDSPSSSSSPTSSSTSSPAPSQTGNTAKFSVKAVEGANACQNYDIVLEGGEPPFEIDILPINASMDNWFPLKSLTGDKKTEDRKYVWNVPYAPDTQLVIGARDKNLTRVLSPIFIVGESKDLGCLPPEEAAKAKGNNKTESKGLSKAVIIAIVIVAILALVLIGGLIYYLVMRKKQKSSGVTPISFEPPPARFEIEEDDHHSAYNYQPEVTPFVITPRSSQAWERHPEPEMFGAYDTVTSTPYPAHIYPGIGSGATEMKPLPMAPAPATLAPPMAEHGQYPSPTYSAEDPYSSSYSHSPSGPSIEPEHQGGLPYLQETPSQYDAAYRPQWTGASGHM